MAFGTFDPEGLDCAFSWLICPSISAPKVDGLAADGTLVALKAICVCISPGSIPSRPATGVLSPTRRRRFKQCNLRRTFQTSTSGLSSIAYV